MESYCMYLLYIKRNKFVSLSIVRFIYGDVCSCIFINLSYCKIFNTIY